MSDMIDWDTAYDNRAAVVGSAEILAGWQAASAAYRAGAGAGMRALQKAESPRERVDLFAPEGGGEGQGFAIFIHGGYWMRCAPADFHWLAAGARSAGWTVGMVGYRLAPEARISEITAEVAAMISAAAAVVPGPIRIAGHSAGGHLACRMVCRDVLPPEVSGRIASVLSISGLHDLRPLIKTPMNEVLGLDLTEARAESPALLEPLELEGAPVTLWVGGAELAEFGRQARLLAEIWGGLGLDLRLIEDPGRDHFTVLAPLAEAGSPLTQAWLGG